MNDSKVVSIFMKKFIFLHKILSEKEQEEEGGGYVVGMGRVRGSSGVFRIY